MPTWGTWAKSRSFMPGISFSSPSFSITWDRGSSPLQHPDTKSLLFGMVQYQAPVLYIPFLVLTVLATIIASQAIISGTFSVVYQGITTRIMPLLKVAYTSSEMKAQIYIPSVNWALMCAVIFMMLIFQKSENLAAAYGMAVTGSMTITSLMMILVFSHIRKVRWKLPIAVGVSGIAFAYFIATLSKLPHGAYWSLILAAIPFTAILIWTKGQQRLYDALRPLELHTFLVGYEQIYRKGRTIAGTALFFCRDYRMISPYIVHTIFRSNIIYERNILISITRTAEPFGVEAESETRTWGRGWRPWICGPATGKSSISKICLKSMASRRRSFSTAWKILSRAIRSGSCSA